LVVRLCNFITTSSANLCNVITTNQVIKKDTESRYDDLLGACRQQPNLKGISQLEVDVVENISREILNSKPNTTSMKVKHNKN